MFDECLYFNTTSLARSLERLWTKAFAEYGLTPSQGFMLRYIVRNENVLPSEIARALNISRPTATRTLDGLVKAELVLRKNTDDGREIVIIPTPKAIMICDGLNKSSGALTAKFKQELGVDKFQDFVNSARAINSKL